MENFKLWNGILNILIISLPFSWYMCWSMYKDLKKKDKIIEIQNKIINEK